MLLNNVCKNNIILIQEDLVCSRFNYNVRNGQKNYDTVLMLIRIMNEGKVLPNDFSNQNQVTNAKA